MVEKYSAPVVRSRRGEIDWGILRGISDVEKSTLRNHRSRGRHLACDRCGRRGAGAPHATGSERYVRRRLVPRQGANRTFLCNYGYAITRDYDSQGSSTPFTSWTVAAVPIIGDGKVVKEIEVAQAGIPSSSGYGIFSLELRENDSKTNTPGTVIATSGLLDAGANQCVKMKVPIPPTRLTRGETYWVEEMIAKSGVSSTLWLFDEKRPYRGISQFWYCLYRSCYSEPWQAIPGDYPPYVRVR